MELTIYYIIIYILEAFILWQYCSNLFYSKYQKRTEGILLVIFYVPLFLVSLLKIFWLNMIAFIIINFILFLVLYQIKWHSALFHTFIVTIVMGLSELLILGINGHFATRFYANRPYFRSLIILAVFSKLIYFSVLQFIVRLLDGSKEKIAKQDKSFIAIIIIPIISTWFMLTLFSICLSTKLSPLLDRMISASAILMLVINLLIFWIYSYNRKKNLKFTELQLQLQKEYDTAEYYKMLLKQDENQKILIHDIKKHLQSIASLNEQNEQEKIASYIDRIIHSSDLQGSVHACDNELLNTILCRHMQSCAKQKISFRSDIRSGSIDYLTDDDLTSLFCNLLDNATKAASKVPESFIELSVVCKANSPLTILTMINSCRKNPFSSGTGRLISTKPDKWRHGFGIKSIQRIVKKYDGDMQMYYDEKCKTFHTIIMLKKY